jgi:chorismate mutase-like protein
MDAGLEALRAEMEAINGELLALLGRRGRLAQRIGALKDRLGVAHFDPAREREMLARLRSANPGPFSDEAIAQLFTGIFRASAELMGAARGPQVQVHQAPDAADTVTDIAGVPPGPLLPPLALGSSIRPRLDRPVFIVAAPRSGGTLLFETLAANPGFHTLGGEAPWVVESSPDLRPGAPGVDSHRLAAELCTPALAAGMTNLIADRVVDAEGEPVSDATSVRLLEKTVPNALRIPFLLKAFPQARFIFLWRDPRENLGSIMATWPGWEEPRTLLPPGWQAQRGRPLEAIAAFQWEAANRTILDDLAGLQAERWTAVNHNDFLADPLSEIRRLCAFADVPFDEAFAAGLRQPLPWTRHTRTAPAPDKWRLHEQAIQSVLPSLEPQWARLRALGDRSSAPPALKSIQAEAPRVVAAPPVPDNRPMRPYALADRDDVLGSVTNRLHATGTSMRRFLESQYGFMPLSHIKDTFGFVEEFTTLYGGRVYSPQRVLSHRDVAELYDLGIGVKLCLQNHFITLEDCVANRGFLARYHRKGNVVICASDVLARFVKEEFPDYVVEASIIKEVHDPAAIAACLEVFDLFTLPPAANDNLDLLAALPDKDRIILFGNARCLYTCKVRNCYRINSVLTKRVVEPEFGTLESGCSPNAPRQFEYTLFDLERFHQMGFRRFKWIIPDPVLHRREDLKPGTYSTKDGTLLRPSTAAREGCT